MPKVTKQQLINKLIEYKVAAQTHPLTRCKLPEQNVQLGYEKGKGYRVELIDVSGFVTPLTTYAPKNYINYILQKWIDEHNQVKSK